MYNFAKSISAVLGGWAWAVFMPAAPVAAACTAMVLADVWSARRLARRIGRRVPSARQSLKFSSARFGRVVPTLLRIYATLALAAVVQNALGRWFPAMEFAGGVVCFWQGVSVLENEASFNPHPWARVLRRYLADKVSRHIKPDELGDEPFE